MAKGKADAQEQVQDYMSRLEHPLKKEIEEVRTIIRNADGRLTEHIKWNAPSYCIDGEDRITFNLQGKGFFRLIFHRGAKVKESADKEPLFEDSTGLLEWVAGDRGIVKLKDMEDVNAKRDKLTQLITKWIEVTGQS
ncbi:DUF1801 domain-containing protein [Paenibacillus sp. DMB20]|uniref:DUF1801 domain-containing protein n=1 Tax=Paenibacillus sp. DMB20 TaxID=1642570 RepID=UPI00069A4F44|nr:DUF1801 domain-containing protein [Paenibacillus sp. DMB20]